MNPTTSVFAIPKHRWPLVTALLLLVGSAAAQTEPASVPKQDLGVTSGPSFARLEIDGARAIVHFDHADGLRTIDNLPVREFFIAGADQRFHAAMATIVDNTMQLRSAMVSKPVAIRYASTSNPDVNLINRARLPAKPFRTDDWNDAQTAVVTNSLISFESMPAGELRDMSQTEGRWRAAAGHAEITTKFARTGKQCLHLHGGDAREVELTLESPGEQRLSFWAERWTSRPPFSFRVMARAGNTWRQIYDGDKELRVGSRLLSHVDVGLPDGTTAVRFVSTSPTGSGVLIDDLQLHTAAPMRVEGAHHLALVVPALVGKSSVITKANVLTAGNTSPVTVTQCKVQFDGATNLAAIATVQALGKLQTATRVMVFDGELALKTGNNEIAVAIELNHQAVLDEFVAATITAITLSDGTTLRPDGHGNRQRIGVAVRTAGQDNCHTYRIPGLATSKQGTLLAVYDNRYAAGSDLPGDIDIGLSRSTDGGATWQPMRVVMDMGNDAAWQGDGIGDPAILVDEVTGRIWIAGIWSHGNRSWHGSGPGLEPTETGQLMLVHSDDDGISWSQPINITKQVKDPSWRFVLQGPGRGFTMRDGTLVFAAQYRSAPDGPHQGHPFSTVIHSTDRGETWQIGTGVKVDTTEAQLVELDDGVLMINCRDDRGGSRSVYTSTNLGKTWTMHPTSRHALIEPTCMASLLRVDHEQLGTLLLFSNPHTTMGRFDMTIQVSKDLGNTWPSRWHTRYDQRPGFGYSCLTRIDDDHIGVLYEGVRELYFLRFSIRELMAP